MVDIRHIENLLNMLDTKFRIDTDGSVTVAKMLHREIVSVIWTLMEVRPMLSEEEKEDECKDLSYLGLHLHL